MRVLVVTTWFPTPASPSTGSFVARDVAAISTRHDVRVLHLCAPGLLGPGEGTQEDWSVPEGTGRVPVQRLAMDPRRPDHVLRAARRLRELAAHADLVHTMAVSALLPMTGWRPDVPWVHTEHWSGLTAPQTLTAPLLLARQGIKRLLQRPDIVAVVGEEIATHTRELRDGPVVVVPNIVEGPKQTGPRRAADRPLGERGPLEVIGIGGLIDRKDPLTAVDTVAELRRRGLEARLTWVGQGPLREATARRGAEHGIPLDLTGALPPEQVRSALTRADVFLLPTRAETFCVAAAEALAAGRPVVVGDSGGPRDFVHPPTGRLVTPGAPATVWADAIERVWADCRGLSAEQIAREMTEGYSAERYAERVDAIYASLTRPGEGLAPAPGHGLPGDTPLVDLVIATHSTARATERAVRSVLDGSGDLPIRVTVVCHNIATEQIATSLSPETVADPRVRLLHLEDGLRSPSGPFMHGLEAATAPWVSIMGSDDRLAPGALAHWLEVARDTGAEVVLPCLELDGAVVPTPQTRLQPLPRRADLDAVRDRLAYRSAPLGLLSRVAVERTGAELIPGAQVGGDVLFGLKLFSGTRVALATRAPYLIGTEADDRTTYETRPIADQLASLDHVLDDPWFASRPADQRRAIGTKLLRIHVFGAILTRPDPAWWTAMERADLAATTRRILDAAPGCADPLSLADHDLLEAILDPDLPATTLLERARARRRFGTPRTLLPGRWTHVLHREAPLRFMAASLLARRR